MKLGFIITYQRNNS